MALCGQVMAQMPCSYSVTLVPKVDCGLFTSNGNPVAINNNGVVAIQSYACGGQAYGRSFLWQEGQAALTPIPFPPGSLGFHVRDLNDAGVAVGMLDMANNVGYRAGVYDSVTGQWTILEPPVPEGHSEALAVSETGLVCGWRSVGGAEGPKQAFVWSAVAGFSDLYLESDPPGVGVFAIDVDDAGRVLVRDALFNGSVGSVWQGEQVTPLGAMPGGYQPVPQCFGPDGVCGGVSLPRMGLPRAFLWKDGSGELLDVVSGIEARIVNKINAHHVMTGTEVHPRTGQRAFVRHGNLRRSLNALTPPSVVHIATGLSINDAGQMLVQASMVGGGRNIVLLPVLGREGDTNCDAVVNVTDLLSVIGSWGPCPGCPGDLNGNDLVNAQDLLEVILNWGTAIGGEP
jgi:hypothetical protein